MGEGRWKAVVASLKDVPLLEATLLGNAGEFISTPGYDMQHS